MHKELNNWSTVGCRY